MIMRTRTYLRQSLLLSALLIFASPGAGRADNLFRFYPELAGSGFYSDNVPLRTQNEEGDFAGTAGRRLLPRLHLGRQVRDRSTTTLSRSCLRNSPDSIGPAKASLSERPTSKICRRRPSCASMNSSTAMRRPWRGIVTSDQAPQFNSVAAQLLLANDQASINQFTATLTHYWGRNWASEFAVHQTTFWNNGGTNNSQNNTSYEQGVSTFTDYHFSDRFSLGGGYRFYDFRFTFPGRPGEEAHWPFVKIGWQPDAKSLSLRNCRRRDFLCPGQQPPVRQRGRHGIGRIRSTAIAF